MSLLDDVWLSTRNRSRLAPKKKDFIKKRSSLPKPRKSNDVTAFPMTQNSPPPKLLHTATKQSKLNDFFKPRDIERKRCLRQNQDAIKVSPEEVNQRAITDGLKSNSLHSSIIDVKTPGYMDGTERLDCKPWQYQGKENINEMFKRAAIEHSIGRGCLHQAEGKVGATDKFETNSDDSDTSFMVRNSACQIQDTHRDTASYFPEKQRQGIKRGILLDEIDKPTVCKRHKQGNSCKATEILSEGNADNILSNQAQLFHYVGPKATKAKAIDKDLQDKVKNIATNKQIAQNEQFVHLLKCFQNSSNTKASNCAKTYNEVSAYNNVEDCPAIEQIHETKHSSNNEHVTSPVYKPADVMQFKHGRLNAKFARKPPNKRTEDTNNELSLGNSSLDLSAEGSLECSQGSGLLFETQFDSKLPDDDDDTGLDLDDTGESMGQSLELCTQFTLSSQ